MSWHLKHARLHTIPGPDSTCSRSSDCFRSSRVGPAVLIGSMKGLEAMDAGLERVWPRGTLSLHRTSCAHSFQHVLRGRRAGCPFPAPGSACAQSVTPPHARNRELPGPMTGAGMIKNRKNCTFGIGPKPFTIIVRPGRRAVSPPRPVPSPTEPQGPDFLVSRPGALCESTRPRCPHPGLHGDVCRAPPACTTCVLVYN